MCQAPNLDKGVGPHIHDSIEFDFDAVNVPSLSGREGFHAARAGHEARRDDSQRLHSDPHDEGSLAPNELPIHTSPWERNPIARTRHPHMSLKLRPSPLFGVPVQQDASDRSGAHRHFPASVVSINATGKSQSPATEHSRPLSLENWPHGPGVFDPRPTP